MVIKNLKLHNFGVYAGDNEFSFGGKKPIVLIGGMNGRGKTTFLEAILLALYGQNSFAFTESEYKTYAQYLRSYVNRNSIDNLCWIELVFDICTGVETENYRIVREWEGFSKRINESITVYKDGEYSEFLTNNWNMFVENVLPSALSNLFFFDGEKIAELAVDTSNEHLKKAIRSMLGISVLDVLKNDLLRNLKRINKDSNESEHAIIVNELREKRESLYDELAQLTARKEQIQQEIDSDNSKRDALIQMYSSRGGVAEEKRIETIQKKSDCVSELSQVNVRLIEYASNELPLSMVKDLLNDIKSHAEIENENLILKKAITQLEALQKSYSAEKSLENDNSIDFVSFVRLFAYKQHIDQIYCLSNSSLYQLTMLTDNKLEDISFAVKEMIQNKSKLEKRIGELDSYLNLDIDNQELEKINEEIRELDSRIISRQIELKEVDNKTSVLESSIREATNAFNKALEIYLSDAEHNDEIARTSKYSEMILKAVDRYMVELQKKKADLLGATITDCYKKLASKKSLINTIVVDYETLDYKFYSDDNKLVPKDSLSAGEKQVTIISILWALAICSKQKLPVIIDTPLSRLDSNHRKTIIKKYFPHASQQTIILSTDSEVNKTYYQMMKDDVGDEYTLVYDEKTKSTSIKKGYDLGN